MKRLLALLICLGLLLTGCGAAQSATASQAASASVAAESATAEATPAPPRTTDPLTGQQVGDGASRRPIAVMLNGQLGAQPQWGVARAKVMIEGISEGKVPSVMCLFSGAEELPRVGPVAQGRDLFLQFAMPLSAIEMQIGSNAYAKNLVNLYGYQNLDGYYVGVTGFDLDQDRAKATNDEYCWYTKQELVDNALALYGMPGEAETADLFHFGTPDLTTASPATGLLVAYGAENSISFAYNTEAGAYDRYGLDWNPQTDGDSGEPVRFENLFVLFCSAGVKDDGYTRDYDLTSGTGVWLCGGSYQIIQWQKGGPAQPLLLYDTAGNELTVATGRSYIGIYGGFAGQGIRVTDADGNEQPLPQVPAAMPAAAPAESAAESTAPAESTAEAPAESTPEAPAA